MSALLPLMLVPLLVWVAVWGKLWTQDQKVTRLERELSRLESRRDGDEEDL